MVCRARENDVFFASINYGFRYPESATCVVDRLRNNVISRNVAYGANGVFNFKTFDDEPYSCNSATFGDPVPGVAKACYSALPDYTMRLKAKQ